MGIQVSPHFVDDVILKEHFWTTGVGMVNLPARLPGTVLGIRLALVSLSRILRSISLEWSNDSMPE